MTLAMPAPVRSRNQRARLRSAALLEPFAISAAVLDRARDDAPVVPVPTRTQRYLEGCIVGRLGYLHDSGRPAHEEAFAVLGIEAQADQLAITARGSGLVDQIHRLLPRWERGSDELSSGVPGLRAIEGPAGDGVLLYLVDRPGRVIIRGLAADELDYRRRELLVATDEASPPGHAPMTPLEAFAWRCREDSAAVASAVIRRLGLLLQTDVVWIDSWWNTPVRFVVEATIRDDMWDPTPRLLSELTSPHLAPLLALDRRVGEHHYLSVKGSTAEIDLRLYRS